jgi:hypothetical protein
MDNNILSEFAMRPHQELVGILILLVFLLLVLLRFALKKYNHMNERGR